jgi:hypothetical protein
MKKKKDTPVSSTNQIDCNNITEILLKVVLKNENIGRKFTAFIISIIFIAAQFNYTEIKMV